MEEARRYAKEFLSGILETYYIEKMPLPDPSNVDTLCTCDGHVEFVDI